MNVAHFNIVRQIGAGGMGEVYEAIDSRLGRRVALKLLPAEYANDPDRKLRFLQEARTASALNHPNICIIHDVGETGDGRPYLAMEYIAGDTLAKRIATDVLPIPESLGIAMQLAEALAVAHEQGIVHRDIKPANIMIPDRGPLKVLDFGLAKISTAPQQSVSEFETQARTEPGLVIGTIPYMSPEQALGKVVDTRSDIFSAGVVLYEMITRSLPFRGETAMDTLDRILHLTPAPLKSSNPGASNELERIVSKCLEKDPLRRYPSASDLLVDLKKLKVDQTGKQSTRKTSRKALQSIAVLPFVHVSGDADTEYFSDGITESLISSLSQIPALRVMAAATVFRFKGKTMDPQQVARDLNVDAVLSGRVLLRSEVLVIGAELVDGRDGRQLWGEQYNRKMADIFATQDELTREITGKLIPKLSSKEKKRLTKRYTENNQAYQAYLRGRYYWNKRTEENLERAVDCFQQAIDQDKNYALAYAGLADAHAILGDIGSTPLESFRKARVAVSRALELDDSLAEAHTSLAHLLMHEYNWAEAEHEFQCAIALNPGYPTAHHWHFMSLLMMGRPKDAIAPMEKAESLDPLSLIILTDVAGSYYFTEQFDLAIEKLQRVLELDPSFAPAHRYLEACYEQLGKFEDAISEFKLARLVSGRPPERVEEQAAGLARAYRENGDTGYWNGRLGLLETRKSHSFVSPYSMAQVYSMLGNKDEACHQLELAYEQSNPSLINLKMDPRFRNLRDETRFKQILRQCGLA